jgi:hypothetical protein
MGLFDFLKSKPSSAATPSIAQEAGLPDNWHPIDVPPINPGVPPSAPGGPPQYTQGSLPPQLGLQPDLVETMYGGSVPTHRLMPIANTAHANAATISVVQTVVQPIAAQTTANTAAILSLTLQQTNFQGVWSSSATYQLNASVDYLGTLYYSLIANNLNNIPASSPTDWKSLGSDAGFVGIWSSIIAYKTSQQVTAADNNYYIALSGSTNVSPIGNPATWQLVGPANLGALIDGTSRFAATGSTLTYRPTTNPLTATDAGSNVTINIASFIMRTSSKGDISVNSGSITALSYSTLYYIYYDDATLVGGAVTYNATVSKTVGIQGGGRFFVGSIVTPAATAPNTTGNSDGGVGAQSGQTAVFLFGESVAVATSAGATINNLTNCIDGNLTTFGSIIANNASAALSTVLVDAASPSSAPWSSLTLFVRSAVPSASGVGVAISIAYSLNGGASFTFIYNVSATRALTVDSIALPTNQNLALLDIEFHVARSAGSGGTAELDFYEAWVVGTT